jgi:tetratricopeptide (TPR) repeat protein
MRVRRDYQQPIFGTRRRSSIGPRGILIFGIAMISILLFVQLRLGDLQNSVRGAFGIQAEPTLYPAEYATQGVEQFIAGNLEAARQMLQRAVALQPENISYLYEYGRVLIELERADEAVTVADRAIEVAPNDVRGYALRANALKWSEPDQAIQDALRGQDIDATFAPLYAAQAIAYTNIQRYTQALEAGDRAITLDPMDADAFRAYSWPLILVGRSGEAIEMLEQAVAINPNLPGPYFQLAFEYKSRANDPAMAVAIYQHIIDNMNPSAADEAKAYLRICETYAGIDRARFDVAEPYCRQAIQIDPNYGSAYRELGRMQYNRRNYEGAIESFRTCERLQANLSTKDIECWSLRGLAHFWMNQCDDAWAVLNEAKTMGQVQGEAQSTMDIIDTGIYNVTQLCTGYVGVPTPTLPPPTPIPPTPIGGL